MLQNASDCNRMRQNASEGFRRHQNALECLKMFQIALEGFRMRQNASDCIRMLQDDLLSHIFDGLGEMPLCTLHVFYMAV